MTASVQVVGGVRKGSSGNVAGRRPVEREVPVHLSQEKRRYSSDTISAMRDVARRLSEGVGEVEVEALILLLKISRTGHYLSKTPEALLVREAEKYPGFWSSNGVPGDQALYFMELFQTGKAGFIDRQAEALNHVGGLGALRDRIRRALLK